MSENKTLFAGSIAGAYHRYLGPLLFHDYARDLAGRVEVPAGSQVLEIACGTGILTGRLKEALPAGARLIATDINPDMVAAAENNLNGSGADSYRTADGTDLPFADNSFDAVVCQFGVMFYPDKVQGYRETLRVLKPGGRFLFNVWDSHAHNRFPALVHETVAGLLPEDPPMFLKAPFAYHDVADIEAELRAAGFAEVEADVLPRLSSAPSARDVALALVTGSPLISELEQKGIADTALDTVESVLVDELGSGEVAAPMRSIVVAARG